MPDLVFELDSARRRKVVYGTLLGVAAYLGMLAWGATRPYGWVYAAMGASVVPLILHVFHTTRWFRASYRLNETGIEVHVPGRAPQAQRWEDMVWAGSRGRRLVFASGPPIDLHPFVVSETDLDSIGSLQPPDSIFLRVRHAVKQVRANLKYRPLMVVKGVCLLAIMGAAVWILDSSLSSENKVRLTYAWVGVYVAGTFAFAAYDNRPLVKLWYAERIRPRFRRV